MRTLDPGHARFVGTREGATAAGPARVVATRGKVEVELRGARAVLAGGTERFEAVPPNGSAARSGTSPAAGRSAM
jgi:hypothetical protein